MIYGTRRRSLRGRDRDDDDDGMDKEQYRYCRCWGVLAAMMPSPREPEFLPFPIDGKLVRRKIWSGPSTGTVRARKRGISRWHCQRQHQMEENCQSQLRRRSF